MRSGYFDDLLIGNFMRTELYNAALYPHLAPIVSKIGGNARVFTPSARRAFEWRLGVKQVLKPIYRKIVGSPTG